MQGDDAVGQIVARELRAERLPPRIAGRADERDLDRSLQQEIDGGQAGGEGARLPGDGLAPGPDRLHRPLAQIVAVEVVREPREGVRGDRVRGGSRPVVTLAVPDDQRLVASARGVEAAVLRREVREDLARQPLRLAQVTPIPGRFVQVEEPGREIRVILEVGVEMRMARPPGAQQPSLRGHEVRAQEGGGTRGRLQMARVAGEAERLRERADHEAVPGGEHLVVEGRRHAPGARLVETRA